MSKDPEFKLCRVCHQRVPIGYWPDHIKVHETQIDAFPDMPPIDPVGRKSKKRRQLYGR